MKANSMPDRSAKSSDVLATDARAQPWGRLAPEMLMMFRITSPQRIKIVLLGVGLVLVIAATAFGQIRLNAWNQPFYNALERWDLHGFFAQLVIFCMIAGALLVLNVAQVWLNQATKVKLREGLVRDLFVI
jgi:vitamin B12/bleomycin/antimicrobial peptide transport system ATP-binding/permease protein